jgi:hypothetical protein
MKVCMAAARWFAACDSCVGKDEDKNMGGIETLSKFIFPLSL